MEDFSVFFEERLKEIEAYLDFLEALETQVQDGTPQLGRNKKTITVEQQRILYSGVYLQLYNLVESTVTLCLDAVSQTINSNSTLPHHLSNDLLKEWVRFLARTHTDLSYEKRLESAISLCTHLVEQHPISDFDLKKATGSNWDDDEINRIAKRLGFKIQISPNVCKGIKQPFRNDMGSLKLIKQLRNQLAHGTLSFVECGEDVTASELRDLTERTSLYLREVVTCFKSSIDNYEFLKPDQRPN